MGFLSDLGTALYPRLRLVVGGVLAGLPVGVVGFLLLAIRSGTREAESVAFALGTLALGFGTLGWSGSILAGRGIENLQKHLDTGSDWTERDSRRAMARIAGFGLGVMVAVSVVASF